MRVLGTTGERPATTRNALKRATLNSMLANGAAGPGSRPVVFDRRYLAGQLLVLKIYCPDELPSMQSFVDKLKSGDVAS